LGADVVTAIKVSHISFSAPVVTASSEINSLASDGVFRLIDLVLASGKVCLADIAELNPDYDVDGRSARIAGKGGD